jgi:hypothetical protein
MATKVKLMKFLQEIRGLTEMCRRHPAPKPSALYLMQLRSHVAEASHAKRKLIVTIDLKDSATLPHPVKINYVKPTLAQEIAPPTVK